ncbi:hypothetical protein [Pontivivens insulae]|uniref:Uncharacterized protein n=1 Tax=Pontivivens insulae TaxID=1639689 RepID=A0A2R8A9L3_9RHOB|nr:hypothetical protein [Pontivivens insulae]RED12823.1 hypothetical protein DFR53_1954 [Pontivivens insulae]SPF28914.1 hypothetical protein POI8812_01217 [Pontivivens insulae]
MNALIIGIIGLVIGAWRARKRGGKAADMATWGLAHGFAFTVVAFFILMWFDFGNNWFF